MLEQSRSIDMDTKNSNPNKLCKATNGPPDELNDVLFSYVPLILIFISQFLFGIGFTLYTTLGRIYLDDNIDQRKTPLMLSYAFAMGMIGPILGYGFAYLTMKIYIDPSKTPTITQDDPRWLGKQTSICLFLLLSKLQLNRNS